MGIFLAAALLPACAALVPGMHMDEMPALQPDGVAIHVTPITLALLGQMEDKRKTAAHMVATEFSSEPEHYRIGPGDILQITVWDHPELTIPAGSFRDATASGQQVNEDGNLYYPYIGVIKAAGMTSSELRVVLTKKLRTYINNPQLDVRIVAFRSKKIYVVGEVERPGVLPLDDLPLMIVDAISLSGGLTANGYKGGVKVSRNGRVYEIDLRALYEFADANQNMMLKHGDIVNVPDRSQQKVFVLGEVRRTAPVTIVNGRLTLSAALGEAGGVRQTTADSSAIYVIRGTDKERPEVFLLDARYATGMLLADRFEMQAQDVIFVDTAGISNWNRFISQLLPSVTFVGVIDNTLVGN